MGRGAARGMDISRWIDHAAAWDGAKVALHVEGEDITYAALAGRIARLAGALRERVKRIRLRMLREGRDPAPP